jgi:putative transposase
MTFDLQFFDPEQDRTIVWRNLPHWAQAGTVCFITWRMADSLPEDVQQRISCERRRLLRDRGIDPDGDWKATLAELSDVARGQVQWGLFGIWDGALDQGHGACSLADPELNKLVGDSLLHFDDDRYVLTDYVVMPNHVHLLAAFRDEETMLSQCTSWKRYTARAIHRHLGQSGPFWQVEPFDHLVRSLDQFEHYRRYIAQNPERAHLVEGSYRRYSKDLTTGGNVGG